MSADQSTGGGAREAGTGALAPDDLRAWRAIVRAARLFHELIPDAVLVGGTAAALHTGHRLSMDIDHVVSDLRERFEHYQHSLEDSPEWRQARVSAATILGSFEGVETGIRQLRRIRPLETEELAVSRGSVRVPTLEEMIRIKGWMVLTRNAVRDFIDMAALMLEAGPDRAAQALSTFDECYANVSPGRGEAPLDAPLDQLLRQLAEPLPGDRRAQGSRPGDPALYRAIHPLLDEWDKVADICRGFAGACHNRANPGPSPGPGGDEVPRDAGELEARLAAWRGSRRHLAEASEREEQPSARAPDPGVAGGDGPGSPPKPR